MNDAKLRRLFWNWHFWAGMIAGPVLIVLSITGAIYIFKPELELWWYADVAAAAYSHDELNLDRAAEELLARHGSDYKMYGIELEPDSGRAPALLMMATDGSYAVRRFYIDPESGGVLGEIPESNLFTVVLDIHRRLMAGTPGRFLTELTTGWTIAVTLLGLVLWWPKNWSRLKGVLVPRIKVKRYVWLRDFHSIGGAFVSTLLLVVAITGLLYSLVWGGVFQMVGFVSGQFDVVVAPPQSVSDPSSETMGLSRLLAQIDELGMADKRMSIHLPQVETDSISVEAGRWYGPSASRIVHLDRASGEVLSDQSLADLPPMAIYTQWNYPLHVGSVGGIVTKFIWLIASVVFVLLPVAGFAMWWTRRRPGKTGFPNRSDAIKPKWLVLLLLVLGFAFPLVGLSILAVWAVNAVRGKLGRSVAAQ
ncbi:MAG: PepSY domain-containing protein [Planctomycetota bacterium]